VISAITRRHRLYDPEKPQHDARSASASAELLTPSLPIIFTRHVENHPEDRIGSRAVMFWPFLRRPHWDPEADMTRMASREARDDRYRPISPMTVGEKVDTFLDINFVGHDSRSGRKRSKRTKELYYISATALGSRSRRCRR
jgi:hypothetical protein